MSLGRGIHDHKIFKFDVNDVRYNVNIVTIDNMMSLGPLRTDEHESRWLPQVSSQRERHVYLSLLRRIHDRKA